MRRWRAVLLLALALGCESAADHTLMTGRLAYRATHQLPAGSDTTLAGVLELEHVSDDSIAGSWRVPGLAPELIGGRWNGRAYEAVASARYLGTIEHRIRPDAATGDIHCEGQFTWVAAEGAERSTPVECALSYGVPFPLEPVEAIPHRPSRLPRSDALP